MINYTFHEMKLTWLEGMRYKLQDGGTLFGPVPKAVWQRFFPVNEHNQIPEVLAPILIQYQGKNYLIDTGLGTDKLSDKQKRNLGVHSENKVEASLAELGLKLTDIDVVLMTHMHNDHAGGLTRLNETGDLVSTFPKAKIYMTGTEWQEVRFPNDRTKGTYLKENWEMIQEQVTTFSDKLQVAPGITMIHTGGHSNGLAVIKLEQAGETMIHMSDLMLTHAHKNPLWVGAVDDYPMDSVAAKQAFLPQAFKNHWKFFFYHDPFYAVLQYDETGQQIVYHLDHEVEPLTTWSDLQDKRLPFVD